MKWLFVAEMGIHLTLPIKKETKMKIVCVLILLISSLWVQAQTTFNEELCERMVNTTKIINRNKKYSHSSSSEVIFAAAIRVYIIDNSREKGLTECEIHNKLTEVRNNDRYNKKDCSFLFNCKTKS